VRPNRVSEWCRATLTLASCDFFTFFARPLTKARAFAFRTCSSSADGGPRADGGPARTGPAGRVFQTATRGGLPDGSARQRFFAGAADGVQRSDEDESLQGAMMTDTATGQEIIVREMSE
jgi:hypothetical protein